MRNILSRCEACLEAGGQHFKSLVQRKVCLIAGKQRTHFLLHAGLCDVSITAVVFRGTEKHLLYIMIQPQLRPFKFDSFTHAAIYSCSNSMLIFFYFNAHFFPFKCQFCSWSFHNVFKGLNLRICKIMLLKQSLPGAILIVLKRTMKTGVRWLQFQIQ